MMFIYTVWVDCERPKEQHEAEVFSRTHANTAIRLRVQVSSLLFASHMEMIALPKSVKRVNNKTYFKFL